MWHFSKIQICLKIMKLVVEPYLESLYLFLDFFHFLDSLLTNIDKIITLEIFCCEQLNITSNYHKTSRFIDMFVVMRYLSAFANHNNFCTYKSSHSQIITCVEVPTITCAIEQNILQSVFSLENAYREIWHI